MPKATVTSIVFTRLGSTKRFHRHKWRKYPNTAKVERLGVWTRMKCQICKKVILT